MEELTFGSGGERCAAWRFAGAGDAFASAAGRPCVVMAHGFGNTRDSGLRPFAERFAAEGLDVLLFDDRGFGDSTGEPRQLVDWRRHREDYAAAIACTRSLPGVDPERIALWGTSYSGGHVIAVAADDGEVAAVISQVPAVDGLAVLVALVRHAGPAMLARATLAGARDALAGALGREPVPLPIVGPPGTLAAMTTPDALAGSRAIAGPTFRNEYCAREGLRLALNRPIARAGEVPCPVLFQIADRDAICPPAAVDRAARRSAGRAEVRRYAAGHFDVYLGDVRERVLADQVSFLRHHLGAAERERVTTA
jgi:uncharacterized protein